MKNTIVLVVGSLVSFLTLLAVALGLMSLKPEWFGRVPPAPAGAIAAATQPALRDTMAAKASTDSARATAQVAPVDSSKPRIDTLLVAQLSSKAKRLELQLDSLKHQLQAKPKPDTTAQQDWKSTAKLIDSMSAEEAYKILKVMPDPDIKQVLAKVKKRQAGKILAMLDPARAAKLLR